MLASSGEITDPCPVPLSLTATTPSSRMPALSHFWIRRMMRRSPIRSPLDPVVQVLELVLEVCLVVLPRQPIHAGCSVLLEFEERPFEQVDADMMEERGEPLLLPFPRHFPYAFQRL